MVCFCSERAPLRSQRIVAFGLSGIWQCNSSPCFQPATPKEENWKCHLSDRVFPGRHFPNPVSYLEGVGSGSNSRTKKLEPSQQVVRCLGFPISKPVISWISQKRAILEKTTSCTTSATFNLEFTTSDRQAGTCRFRVHTQPSLHLGTKGDFRVVPGPESTAFRFFFSSDLPWSPPPTKDDERQCAG